MNRQNASMTAVRSSRRLPESHPSSTSPEIEHAGARRLLAQLTETATLAVYNPAVRDDERGLGRALQDGNVGNRVLVPDDDVGQLTGGNHADLAGEIDHRGIAAGVGDDRLHRCHADLFDEQLSLLAMPRSVAEGGRMAGVAAAQYRDAAVTGIADHSERGVELRPQAIAHPVAKTSPR